MSLNTRPDIYGEVCFSVYGVSLDFAALSENIPLPRVEIQKRGEPRTSKINGEVRKTKRVAKLDRWSIEVEFRDDQSHEETFTEFLEDLLPYSQYIDGLVKSGVDARIGCFIRSDQAQLGIRFSSEAAVILGELGVPIDIHVLSYGMMDNGQSLLSLLDEI